MEKIFLLEQTELVNTLISTLETHNYCVNIKWETNEEEEEEISDVQIWWLVKPDFHDIIQELNLTTFSFKGQVWANLVGGKFRSRFKA